MAAALGITPEYLAVMKKRNRLPLKEMADFCARRHISINWLLYNQHPDSITSTTRRFFYKSNLPPPIQLATPPKKEPARQIKDETAIIAALEKEAKRYLGAQVPILGSIKRPIECWAGYTKKQVKSVCIYSLFGKLFETTDLIGARLPVVSYIFHHIVGYSDFFACPVIILRDRQDRVVDICFYRPRRPDRELPKYLCKPADKKLAGWGKYFLYPFQ